MAGTDEDAVAAADDALYVLTAVLLVALSHVFPERLQRRPAVRDTDQRQRHRQQRAYGQHSAGRLHLDRELGERM